MNWDDKEDVRLLFAIGMVLVLVCALLGEQGQGQALPDAPSAVPVCSHIVIEHCINVPAQPKWITFRGVYRDAKGHQRFDANAPALKTSKSMWLVYGAAHGAMFGAWALSNHKVEAAHSEIPAMAAVSGADLLMLKFFSPMMMFEAPVYGIQHYLRNR